MTISLADIQSETTSRPPRIVLLGHEKVGKSTFASGAPAPVFVPVQGEEGLDALTVPRFPPAGSFDQALDTLRVLHRDDHDYRTVVLDSASALEPLVWRHVCEQNRWTSIESPGYGKGYVKALSCWRRLTSAFDHLRDDRGMSVILVGHTRVKTVNDPRTQPFDAFTFDIHDRAASAIFRWADCILFASTKLYTTTSEGGFGKTTVRATGSDERVLYTQKRPHHPGGGRGVFGQLPYELPLSWAAFDEAVRNHSNQQSPKEK